MAYATIDDAYMCLTAQGFRTLPRPVVASQVDITTGTFRLKTHGFSVADLLLFENVSGGALPAGLSGFVYYTPIIVGSDLFKVATAQGGSTPIAPLVSAGSGWGVSLDPIRRLMWHLEETAGRIDEVLTAYTPPLQKDPITGKYPWQVVGMNARMAVLAAINSLQIENAEARKSLDRILAQEEADKMTRAGWLAGKPINPGALDQSTTVEQGALACAGDYVDWPNGGGI